MPNGVRKTGNTFEQNRKRNLKRKEIEKKIEKEIHSSYKKPTKKYDYKLFRNISIIVNIINYIICNICNVISKFIMYSLLQINLYRLYYTIIGNSINMDIFYQEIFIITLLFFKTYSNKYIIHFINVSVIHYYCSHVTLISSIDNTYPILRYNKQYLLYKLFTSIFDDRKIHTIIYIINISYIVDAINIDRKVYE